MTSYQTNKSCNPKISIIVPVYKVEQYLHRCIDSILAQTFTDFELLLIDNKCSAYSIYATELSKVLTFYSDVKLIAKKGNKH